MTVIGDYIFAPGINGSLYFSTDGKEWQEDSSKTVKSIVGVLSDGETSQLVLVTERNGDNYFSELILDAENLTYTITDSDKQVSANFPLEDFSSVNYEKIDYSPLMVVFSGEGDAWFTRDGSDWEQYASVNIPVKKGYTVVRYDDQLYLIGGFNNNGTASKEIFISKDRGINWSPSGTLVALPSQYKARGYASVLVDKNNYMFIIGGKEQESSSTLLDEIWRGRINRLGFAIQ